jgi:hypothetical protein
VRGVKAKRLRKQALASGSTKYDTIFHQVRKWFTDQKTKTKKLGDFVMSQVVTTGHRKAYQNLKKGIKA